jgi:hypothetical protein
MLAFSPERLRSGTRTGLQRYKNALRCYNSGKPGPAAQQKTLRFFAERQDAPKIENKFLMRLSR